MTKAIPFIKQGSNIILVADGKSHMISEDTHISYTKIVEALKAEDWDEVRSLVDQKSAFINYGKGYLAIVDSVVYWKDEPFHNALAARMIEMYKEGFSIEPMIQFVENLMSNPSMRSVDQLYTFLEKNSLPITNDGHFLAFKRVRDDYKDIHTGTIDNTIGSLVVMERNRVDDNPDSLCSYGLHFCSESYLDKFGNPSDPIMILKINPADVVSIPSDYNGAKGRCMRYRVVDELIGDPASAFNSSVNNDYVDDRFDDDSFDIDRFAAEVDDDSTLYNLRRVYGDNLEYTSLTKAEAEEQIAKNVRQKKAQLKLIKR